MSNMSLKSRQDGSIPRAVILGHHRLLPRGAQREAKEQGGGTELCPPPGCLQEAQPRRCPAQRGCGAKGHGSGWLRTPSAEMGTRCCLPPQTAAVTQLHAAPSTRWDPCPALTGASHGDGG